MRDGLVICTRHATPARIIYCSDVSTAWIGLRHDGNNVRWDDSSQVDFLDWYDGEPIYDTLNWKYCVVLKYGQFASESPRSEYPYVCQMNHEVPAEPMCPPPFISLGGRCIFLNVHDYDWFGALRSCSNMCTNCTLASVHNQEELNILYDMLYEE